MSSQTHAVGAGTMSFAGGTGHKSPFGERAKSTKSPLSVKRNGSVGVSRAAQRGVRHSLFAREPPSSSPTAKGMKKALNR